jgi:hypothetical protein
MIVTSVSYGQMESQRHVGDAAHRCGRGSTGPNDSSAGSCRISPIRATCPSSWSRCQLLSRLKASTRTRTTLRSRRRCHSPPITPFTRSTENGAAVPLCSAAGAELGTSWSRPAGPGASAAPQASPPYVTPGKRAHGLQRTVSRPERQQRLAVHVHHPRAVTAIPVTAWRNSPFAFIQSQKRAVLRPPLEPD